MATARFSVETVSCRLSALHSFFKKASEVLGSFNCVEDSKFFNFGPFVSAGRIHAVGWFVLGSGVHHKAW